MIKDQTIVSNLETGSILFAWNAAWMTVQSWIDQNSYNIPSWFVKCWDWSKLHHQRIFERKLIQLFFRCEAALIASVAMLLTISTCTALFAWMYDRIIFTSAGTKVTRAIERSPPLVDAVVIAPLVVISSHYSFACLELILSLGEL